jgi:hypothetical protein
LKLFGAPPLPAKWCDMDAERGKRDDGPHKHQPVLVVDRPSPNHNPSTKFRIKCYKSQFNPYHF